MSQHPVTRGQLLAECQNGQQRSAVQALLSVASRRELAHARDPEFWDDLAARWLRRNRSRSESTARSYASMARKAMGVSRLKKCGLGNRQRMRVIEEIQSRSARNPGAPLEVIFEQYIEDVRESLLADGYFEEVSKASK